MVHENTYKKQDCSPVHSKIIKNQSEISPWYPFCLSKCGKTFSDW